MRQFRVYPNPNAATRVAYPYLLNVQSDLVGGLGSRVMVPLAPADAFKGMRLAGLMPILRIEAADYVMLTAQASGISIRGFGSEVIDLSPERAAIMAALDMLISGI